jgi:hypothetical protein
MEESKAKSTIERISRNDLQELGSLLASASLRRSRAKQSREAQGVSMVFEGVVGHTWVLGRVMLAYEPGVRLQIADRR